MLIAQGGIQRHSLGSRLPGAAHALDSLRALMMLLGIYLHTVVGYSRDGGWPYKDPHPTAVLDATLGFIHIFRMPVFFAALLYHRRGAGGFLRNRFKRVLLPFVAGWLVLFPTVAMLAAWGKLGAAAVVPFTVSGEFLRYAHPMHLWLLEYLLALYVVALGGRLLPSSLRQRANSLFRAALPSPLLPLIFAVPSLFALLPMQGSLADPRSFLPVPRILAAYLVVFAFGWLLYRNVDLLDGFRRHAPVRLAAGLACGLFYLFTHRHHVGVPATAAANALALWFFVFGLTGLFLRYLDHPSPRMRYLSDSSYALYLIHMPVLMALQIALKDVAWPTLLGIFPVYRRAAQRTPLRAGRGVLCYAGESSLWPRSSRFAPSATARLRVPWEPW